MLAPAGNRIQFDFDQKAFPDFNHYVPIWCQSGTAALALSIIVAKLKKNVETPEVIIPAYACPDLVAACAYAETSCQLCDLDSDNTAFSLEELKNAINEKTIAIVAVNFLGIEERLQELRQIAHDHQIVLIEDNAQWFPELERNEHLTGDCVSLSFGRGKPVTMLGGGLALIKQSFADNPEIKTFLSRYEENIQPQNSASFVVKSLLYNALITPFFYGLLNYVPGLQLGLTKYKQLESIEAFDDIKRRFLGLNTQRYCDLEPTAQLYLQTHLEGLPETTLSLPNKYLYRTKRLLRFPILFEDSSLREQKYDDFMRAGLGASKLYDTIIPNIEGTQIHLCKHDDFPNAHDFSSRLLTLPVHSLVQRHHLDKMIDILMT